MAPDRNELAPLRVFVRIRPGLPREPPLSQPVLLVGAAADGRPSVSVVHAASGEAGDGGHRKRITGPTAEVFTFDGVFDPSASQEEMYKQAAAPQVRACLRGFNSTVFCYGPSGTGKSFTCYGPEGGQIDAGKVATTRWATSSAAGIIPRAAQQLFDAIASDETLAHGKFLIRVSFLQLYRENVGDLLSPHAGSLQLREDPQRGVFVEGITEVTVRGPSEVWALAARGQRARATAATRINDVSSRSHAIFTVVVEQQVRHTPLHLCVYI